jgi:hypothetical protein
LRSLCVKIEEDCHKLEGPSHHQLQKLAHAAERAFADRALLLDESMLLFEQNNEKKTRASIKSTVAGNTKVMSYDDIIEAKAKRNKRDAQKQASKRSREAQSSKSRKRKRPDEVNDAGDAKH